MNLTEISLDDLASALAETDGPGSQLSQLSYQEIAQAVLARLAQRAQLAAAEQAEADRRTRIGREARTAQAERYPSWCIRHQRRLSWLPFPVWWYHADGHEQIAENAACAFMRSARAPEGKV